MSKLHNILKALALGTVPVVGAFVVWMLWPVRGAIVGARAQGYALSVKAGAVLGHVDAVALDGGKLVNDSRVTVSEMNRAALDERKYFEVTLPPLVGQARGILSNVETDTADLHGVLTRAQGAADALTTAVQTVNTSIPKTQPLVDAATAAIGNVDADRAALTPELHRLISASADTAVQVSGIAANTNKISATLEKTVDAHKPWWKKVGPALADMLKISAAFF